LVSAPAMAATDEDDIPLAGLKRALETIDSNAANAAKAPKLAPALERLKATANVSGLLEAAQGDQLTSVLLAAACLRKGVVTKASVWNSARAALDGCIDRLHPMIEKFTLAQACEAMHALRLLHTQGVWEHPRAEEALVLVAEVAQMKIAHETLEPADLLNLLVGLRQSETSAWTGPAARTHSRLLFKGLEVANASMREMGSGLLAHVVAALAKAAPTHFWENDANARFFEKVDSAIDITECSGEELSKLAFGFARAELWPDALFEKVKEQLLKVLHQTGLVAQAQICRAFVAADFLGCEPLFNTIAAKLPVSLAQPGVSPAVVVTFAGVYAGLIHKGIGVQAKPAIEAISAWCDKDGNLGLLMPQEFVELVTFLAVRQIAHYRLLDRACHRAKQSLTGTLPPAYTFTTAQLVDLLWSVASVSCVHTPLFDAVGKALRAEDLTVEQLERTCYAYWFTGHAPRQRKFVMEMADAVMKFKETKWQPVFEAAGAVACAGGAKERPELYERLFLATAQRVQELHQYWGTGRDKFLRKDRDGELFVVRLLNVFMCFRLEHKKENQAMKDMCQNLRKIIRHMQSTPHQSTFQVQISKAAAMLFSSSEHPVEVNIEYVTKEGIDVDIAIPQLNLVVEVDGLGGDHFVNDIGSRQVVLNGKTLLKKRLLQASDWKVFNVQQPQISHMRPDANPPTKQLMDYLRNGIEKTLGHNLAGTPETAPVAPAPRNRAQARFERVTKLAGKTVEFWAGTVLGNDQVFQAWARWFNEQKPVWTQRGIQRVTHLDLSNNNLSDTGVFYLVSVLMEPDAFPVDVIDLSDNRIGDGGVEALSDMVMDLATEGKPVKEIRLAGNYETTIPALQNLVEAAGRYPVEEGGLFYPLVIRVEQTDEGGVAPAVLASKIRRVRVALAGEEVAQAPAEKVAGGYQVLLVDPAVTGVQQVKPTVQRSAMRIKPEVKNEEEEMAQALAAAAEFSAES